MAKKIIWSREAIQNVVSIAEYIEVDSEYYASVFVNEIYEKAETLKTLENRGRIVPEILDENTREIFIGEYRLIYRVDKTNVNIVTVIHGRRDLRKILSKKNK